MMRPTRLLHRGALVALLLAGCGAALLGAAVAQASYAPQAQVSGQVTAVNGQAAVTVNGQTYLIALDSAAYQAVLSVHVGDTIGLVLDGPPSASTSHVIFILSGAGGTSTTSSGASSASSP